MLSNFLYKPIFNKLIHPMFLFNSCQSYDAYFHPLPSPTALIFENSFYISVLLSIDKNNRIRQCRAPFRETREGWPLPNVETEENGDSMSILERALPRFVCWACCAGTREFCPHRTLFHFICPPIARQSAVGL